LGSIAVRALRGGSAPDAVGEREILYHTSVFRLSNGGHTVRTIIAIAIGMPIEVTDF